MKICHEIYYYPRYFIGKLGNYIFRQLLLLKGKKSSSSVILQADLFSKNFQDHNYN